MVICSTASPGTPARSVTSSSSRAVVAVRAERRVASRRRRLDRRSTRSPDDRQASRRTRPCSAPAISSGVQPRRCATRSTCRSWWSVEAWRSGSDRRSSMRPRWRSTSTPDSRTAEAHGSPPRDSATRGHSSVPAPSVGVGCAVLRGEASASRPTLSRRTPGRRTRLVRVGSVAATRFRPRWPPPRTGWRTAAPPPFRPAPPSRASRPPG